MKELLEAIPIPPKMYRHFAVITVLITGCIAIFADTENREAISNEIDQQQQQAALRSADAKNQTPVKYDPNRFKTSGNGFGVEGAVEPPGGDSGARPTSGRQGLNSAQTYDTNMFPPGMETLPQGKLPQTRTGPRVKPPKMPTTDEKARFERAAEERAGAPTGTG